MRTSAAGVLTLGKGLLGRRNNNLIQRAKTLCSSNNTPLLKNPSQNLALCVCVYLCVVVYASMHGVCIFFIFLEFYNNKK